MNHYIQIIEYATGKTIKEKGPYSERKANKIDDGMNINLNHDKYFTRVFQKMT